MSNTTRNIIRIVAIGIILTLLGPVAVIAQNTDRAKEKELQDMYVKYLVEEGYKPEIDGDGDVLFKREGRTYFIGVSELDPGFFRVVLANFWPINSVEERLRVLAAADYSNAELKVLKVFTVKNNVWAAIELFVASPADFRGRFQSLHVNIGQRGYYFCAEDARTKIGLPSKWPVINRHQPTSIIGGFSIFISKNNSKWLSLTT